MSAKNALAKLIMQYQTSPRALPDPVAAKVLPFHQFDFGRDPRRQKNDTITSDVLGAKTDAGNPILPATPLNSVLDLRTVGYLLKLLLGQPVTTGTTLKTHTYPVDLADRPYALIEIQHADISKFYRYLGVRCNKLAWDIRNMDQNISAEMLGEEEIDPIPTSAFDGAPTSVASFRANGGSGVISDGAGGTLGQVVGGAIEISNNLTPEELANGLSGHSLFDVNDLTFSGTIKAVFDGAGAYDLARTGTSTRLKLVSAATIGADTFDLTVDMPYVELIEKAVPRSGKSGMLVDLAWKAHTGATLPTVVLRNDVASF